MPTLGPTTERVLICNRRDTSLCSHVGVKSNGKSLTFRQNNDQFVIKSCQRLLTNLLLFCTRRVYLITQDAVKHRDDDVTVDNDDVTAADAGEDDDVTADIDDVTAADDGVDAECVNTSIRICRVL